MKFIYKPIVVLMFFLSSWQLIAMETARDEKPTEFLFRAMEYYEQGDFTNAAQIFRRYAGKPVPVAEPFCLDLVKKGFLPPFDPVPSPEDSGEDKKACLYFNATQEFLKIKQQVEMDFLKKKLKLKRKGKGKRKGNEINETDLKQTLLRTACLKAVQTSNSPLLYVLGCLYEKEDKGKAKEFFWQALTKINDLRAIFGLKRVCSPEYLKGIKISGIPFASIHGAFNLMPILHQDEGEILAKMSGHFSECLRTSDTFLLAAAQFGHAGAQHLMGISHCTNETKTLYWMMQSAESNYLKALSLCGHMLETGMGTPINYEKAYLYLQRAAYHPLARDVDFSNFGLIHERGKGTPVSYPVACEWYQKGYEASPDNPTFIYDYGRVLNALGEYEKALPLLTITQHLNDGALYEYGVALFNQNLEGNAERAVPILLQLALGGHINSAFTLAALAVRKEIPCDNVTLGIYKACLDQAIEKEKLKKESQDRNEGIANAYLQLRNIYITARDLFDDNTHLINFSEKVYQFNPEDQEGQFAYASDLKEMGQYQQALEHLLFLQKAGYPVSLNTIGSCYDMLAKQTQSEKKAEWLVAGALKYYQQELEKMESPQRATAAFNIYCLSTQKRIPPRSDKEIVDLLSIAADGGDEDACNDLGMAFKVGFYGLESDLVRAENLLRKAMEKGCWQAKINMMNFKIGEDSPEAKEQAKQLREELWNEHPEELKTYLQNLVSAVECLFETTETEEDEPYSETKMEESKLEEATIQNQETQDFDSSSTSENVEYFNAGEVPQLQPVPTIPVIQNQPNQEIRPTLSKRQRAEQEENERLQRKYERMMTKVENLRNKKQTKYRKIQTLIGQHINNFSGAVKNSKGSGRRVEINGIHSGFHQPHTANMKGGALKSVVNLMGDVG